MDVILGSYPWLSEALTHVQHDPAGYPVLDLPYLVIMKMNASRVQDMPIYLACLAWPPMASWLACAKSLPATRPMT